MPSASTVANGGTTRSLCSSVMSSLGRSSRTSVEFVLMHSACPPTINVTLVRAAMNHMPPTSAMLVANVVAWIARWIRNLRTRVGLRPTFLHSIEEGFGGSDVAGPKPHVHGW